MKIIDVGFCADNTQLASSMRGTDGYMAPEVRNQETYDPEKADIFSFGVVVFIFLTGNAPFVRARNDDTFYNLFRRNPDRFWKQHMAVVPNSESIFTPDMMDFI